MDSKQLSFFRTMLFFFGLVIIGVAFIVVNHPISEKVFTEKEIFFWVEIVLCYLVFFVPFFFSSIKLKTLDIQIPSTTNLWMCIIFFEIVAIVLSILVLRGTVSIRIAILVELVVLFFSAIFVYFGYFAGHHIGNVQAREEISLSKIAELKNAFAMLNLKIDMWGGDYSEQKAKIKKICDDVRYMSPVDTDSASNLEMKLIIAANVLAESTMSPSEMDVKIQELLLLVNQRKLLKK